METRSAALNLAVTLIEGIKDEDDYNRASSALSFAKHGGVDACAHMLATAPLGLLHQAIMMKSLGGTIVMPVEAHYGTCWSTTAIRHTKA